MTTDKGFERNPEANLTNLIGNLSMPAPLFRFKNFNIFSTFLQVTRILQQKSLSEQDWELTSDLILQTLR